MNTPGTHSVSLQSHLCACPQGDKRACQRISLAELLRTLGEIRFVLEASPCLGEVSLRIFTPERMSFGRVLT
jgi:hypothetical protein